MKLPAEDQQRLLRFLLRIVPINQDELPKVRMFSAEQIRGWIKEDEEVMRRFLKGA